MDGQDDQKRSGRQQYDDVTGLLVPDLELQASNRTLLRAARGAGSHGLALYGVVLRSEHKLTPPAPLMLAVQQLPDPDIRRYTIPALLRSKLKLKVAVSGGRTPAASRRQLTPVGRQVAEAISSIYGVFYATVGKHEIDVYLSASFTWHDDFGIHDQIMAIITPVVESPTGQVTLLRQLTTIDRTCIDNATSPESPDEPPDAMAS
jgi:hypothetical protein